MLTTFPLQSQQIPLIHCIHADDKALLSDPDSAWFKILYEFPWEAHQGDAANYYDALYEFNKRESNKTSNVSQAEERASFETKEEAKLRLLCERPTMLNVKEDKVPIIFQGKALEPVLPQIDPLSISPGVVPIRLGGKKPKCFFSLFKSFLGATLMGLPPEPETVYLLLTSNPSFARVCGFATKDRNGEYCYKNVPGLRKLEQFDQIMTEWGIWGKIKLDEVRHNLKTGVIEKENELVGDTTHYHAYSGFETVTYKDENGKNQKKSQSKPTKNCRCKDRNKCPHEWELGDQGTGTVVKAGNKMYWAQKGSVLGFPRQGIPLDAVAITDASTYDGKTLLPHVKKIFADFPEIVPNIIRILYDSACDDEKLKKIFKDEFQIDLKASFNPRRAKEITADLPRGIDKITPYGVPICKAGYEMDYKGIRFESEKFIYQAPITSDGTSVCLSCPNRFECSPNSSKGGRTINVSFQALPHINANDPPMAKRFKAIMSRRPSVERMIKRLKCDLSDDRLTKRGSASFQAYLDKTMIAFHILLRH